LVEFIRFAHENTGAGDVVFVSSHRVIFSLYPVTNDLSTSHVSVIIWRLRKTMEYGLSKAACIYSIAQKMLALAVLQFSSPRFLKVIVGHYQ
jgi:hypothetical protein